MCNSLKVYFFDPRVAFYYKKNCRYIGLFVYYFCLIMYLPENIRLSWQELRIRFRPSRKNWLWIRIWLSRKNRIRPTKNKWIETLTRLPNIKNFFSVYPFLQCLWCHITERSEQKIYKQNLWYINCYCKSIFKFFPSIIFHYVHCKKATLFFSKQGKIKRIGKILVFL